jgi:hypothetical protein
LFLHLAYDRFCDHGIYKPKSSSPGLKVPADETSHFPRSSAWSKNKQKQKQKKSKTRRKSSFPLIQLSKKKKRVAVAFAAYLIWVEKWIRVMMREGTTS